MSTRSPFRDIGEGTVRMLHLGEHWSTKQSRLLNVKLLFQHQHEIDKCEKTLRRWSDGAYPIPLHEGFHVAGVTGEWRLIRSYALEQSTMLAPIAPRISRDVELELMQTTKSFADYVALFLEIKHSKSPIRAEDLQRLRDCEAQLHQDIAATTLALTQQSEEQH